jgi:hypothetical protein
MVVEILIPDLSARTSGFPAYWTNLIFAGNRPANPSAHALVNGYVRLTESAIRSYESGRLLTRQGWLTHDRVLERISAGLNRDSPEDLDRRMWWH